MLIMHSNQFPAMSASVGFVQRKLKVQSMLCQSANRRRQSSPCVLFSWKRLFRTVPKLQTRMAQFTSVEFLKAIMYERSTIVLVGKYVHEVLQEFYAVPLRRS
jgi:hypothetical protein